MSDILSNKKTTIFSDACRPISRWLRWTDLQRARFQTPDGTLLDKARAEKRNNIVIAI